jgi:transcription-repair coupling factor (superfamily II helicase)
LRLEAYHKLSAASSSKSSRKDLDAILAELEDRFGKAPEPVLQLLQVTELRQQANRLGLKDVNLLGVQAKLSPVDLSDSKMVALSHKLPQLRYLQSSKLLSVPMPISQGMEPIRSSEVIDWLWQLFAIVFEESLGKATEPN